MIGLLPGWFPLKLNLSRTDCSLFMLYNHHCVDRSTSEGAGQEMVKTNTDSNRSLAAAADAAPMQNTTHAMSRVTWNTDSEQMNRAKESVIHPPIPYMLARHSTLPTAFPSLGNCCK